MYATVLRKIILLFSRRLTALHWACTKGHADSAKLLLENGADFRARDSQYGTPAMTAMAFGNMNCLKIVLHYTAKDLARQALNRDPPDEDIALYFIRAVNGNIAGLASAIENKHQDVVDYVLDFDDINVNVNLHPKEVSLLVLAVESEMEDTVVKLLAKGAHVNGEKYSLKASLIEAAANGDVQAWKSLYRNNDANIKSPLMYAAEKGNLSILKILFEKGADINMVSPRQYIQYHERNNDFLVSAVYFAAREGHAECLKFLLDHNPSSEALLTQGYVALLETMCNGNADCVNLLMKHGLDPNKRHSWTTLCQYPLSEACEKGYVDCVRTLIEHGANVNNNDKHGPALEYCVKYRHYDMIDILLEAGSSVNNSSPGRQSALWFAAQHGDVEIVRQLLRRGADTNTLCVKGETPIFIAANLGHTDCLKEILAQKDTAVNVTNHDGCTAIVGAIRNQKLDSVSMLLKYGLQANLCQPVGNKYSRSEGNLYPLMWAINTDYPSCVDYLLSHGADPSLVSVYGQNSYQHAISQDRADCLSILLEHQSSKHLVEKERRFKSVLQRLKDLKKGLVRRRHTVCLNELLIESMRTYPRTSPECAAVLLFHGADVNYRNRRHMSSLDFAAERIMIQHARLLLNHNADVSSKRKSSRNLMSHIGVDGVASQKLNNADDMMKVMKMLLLVAGHDTNQKYEKVPNDLKDFSDLISHKCLLTLQGWCRSTIRKHLMNIHSGNLFCLIPQLPIPKSVQKYLSYTEQLEELEQELEPPIYADERILCRCETENADFHPSL